MFHELLVHVKLGKGSTIAEVLPLGFSLCVYLTLHYRIWVCTMIAVVVVAAGALGLGVGLLRNREEIERVRRQQQVINTILFGIVFLLVIIDVAILVYFINYNPPSATDGDSYTSLFRKYVERLLNLESNKPIKWDYQTVLFVGILLYVNLFFFGLIGLFVCQQRERPYIHVGDNISCSIVTKLSVGAAAVSIVIALATWSVYRNLPL